MVAYLKKKNIQKCPKKKSVWSCIGNSAYIASYTEQLLPHSTLKSKNQKSKIQK